MSHTHYEPVRTRLQRSELCVPCSQSKFFAKAIASAADYILLDLEDAVAPDDKEQARRNVIEALYDFDWRGAGKTVSIRINGIELTTCTGTWSISSNGRATGSTRFSSQRPGRRQMSTWSMPF